MGLLDDAIRDHLELKRLRGADPGEVAREQKEALAPAPGVDAAGEEDWAPAAEDLDSGTNGETLPVAATPAAAPGYPAEPDGAADAAGSVDSAAGGQETVELDMQTVMDEDEREAAGRASGEGPTVEGSAGGGPSVEDVEGDQLEWEVPGETSPDAEHHHHALGDEGPEGTAGRLAT